jgi:hypothetical protein
MELPQPRRELGDASGRLYGDALQHIDEVGVRIDVVEPASDDEALYYPDVAPSSVQQKFQFFRPRGIARSARSK